MTRTAYSPMVIGELTSTAGLFDEFATAQPVLGERTEDQRDQHGRQRHVRSPHHEVDEVDRDHHRQAG